MALYHDKPLPHLPLNVTLNTVLSIWSQIASMCLVATIAKSISQLKWLWFTEPKRLLADFGAFDDASRGPYGSLLLLFRLRFRHRVSLGALLTIFLLALQPFVQQAVQFPERLEPAGNATISRGVVFYEVDTGPNHNNSWYLINTLKGSIYHGLYDTSISLSEVSPMCPSGYCTLPQHTSLAICASMADVTPSLQTYCSNSSLQSCTFSLPSGGILASGDVQMSLYTANNSEYASIAFQNSTPIIDFYTYFVSNKTGQPLLFESTLNVCAHTYNISVKDGQIGIELVSVWDRLNTSINYVVEVPGIAEGTIVMGDYSFACMTRFLQTIFTGTFINDSENFIYGSDAIEVLVETLLVPPYDEAAMDTFLNGLATSLTNALRTAPGSEIVTGTSYKSMSFVQVAWEWLIFPILLVILTFIFLLDTKKQSSGKRTDLWKMSSLATFQGLSSQLHRDLGPMANKEDMSQRTKDICVQLEKRREGWRLVASQ
ncbi:MAG: hypothetical protein MMC33_010320 [Icmadophila ericetorum]|nr:hypothetical protein [Icmadophila ericetorum]